MGNKAAKEYIMQKRQGKPQIIKEELEDYLTSLTDIAKKGSKKVRFDDIPRVRCNSEGASTSQKDDSAVASAKSARRRYKRSNSECHPSQLEMMEPRDVDTMPNLLDKDDGADWAEMREWLVWCMDANLREDTSLAGREDGNQHSLASNADT